MNEDLFQSPLNDNIFFNDKDVLLEKIQEQRVFFTDEVEGFQK